MATRTFANLAAFAAFLGTLPARMEAANRRDIERAARLVQREAQESIGEYQPAAPPFAAWSPLAQSTVEDKVAKGFAPPDNPLLRTGAMRASIEYNTAAGPRGAEAEIGSNLAHAVYQEMGTPTIPPRSFLGSAAARRAADIVRILGGGAVAVLSDDAGRDIDVL